jgi:uncharacterized protein (DUF983 family)
VSNEREQSDLRCARCGDSLLFRGWIKVPLWGVLCFDCEKATKS